MHLKVCSECILFLKCIKSYMKETLLYADMHPGKVMDFFKVEEARIHD